VIRTARETALETARETALETARGGTCIVL
jgi:hypothetical protein